MKNLVVLDFGSNSVRLSINKMEKIDNGHRFAEVKRLKETTRLAEGMGNEEQKKLSPGAIKRTIQAIKYFKRVYQTYPDYQVLSIATAAVREATNSQEFIDEVLALTGSRIHVLSGNDEAYYDYLGVISTLPIKNFMIVDMGGGSVELAIVKKRQLMHSISLPYGAVGLSEQFCQNGALPEESLKAFKSFSSRLFDGLSWLNEAKGTPLVLLGGCNRTVARIKRAEEGFTDLDNIHGFELDVADFKRIYANLLEYSTKERLNIKGMEEARSDIILGGMTPLDVLLKRLDSKKIVFSESGVREGLLYEMVDKKKI
ncbi:Ppx/GppA phosphatase family protein [Liquorilactobacillus mali]|uniref:Ppx/GppA phosphatase family protein n=1 Tax=Liquorilactobacillus mali TaxID=1618 RepID=UPI002952B5CD|nr:Ppx/GppA phosphatase family protein [Liquorilactobacillus mali]MDV7758143.1 Ppx/GppA family phosphatase [Liquorilactobacillus mali]